MAVIIRGILPCRLNDVDDTEKAALSLNLFAPYLRSCLKLLVVVLDLG